jgi:ATP-dependent DNA ligase
MKPELCIPSRCTAKLPEDFSKAHLVAEEKLDGSRYVLYLGGCPYERRAGHTLLSRRGSVSDGKLVDRTENVPHITKVDYAGLDGTVLDGEIMSSDFLGTNSIMNSSPLEAIRKQKEMGNLKYYVFDVMFFRGKDVRTMPLEKRRKILEEVVRRMDNEFIQAIPQFSENIEERFKEIVNNGGEGLIIKDSRLAYGQGWSKMKKSYDVSCVISGWKEGTGKYKGMIGSIALSVFKDGKLVEIGFASGFDDALRIDMSKNFSKYEGKVVDVFAQEIQKIDAKNPSGRLRHPTFHRFRDDVNAEDCTSEKLWTDIKSAVKSTRSKE